MTIAITGIGGLHTQSPSHHWKDLLIATEQGQTLHIPAQPAQDLLKMVTQTIQNTILDEMRHCGQQSNQLRTAYYFSFPPDTASLETLAPFNPQLSNDPGLSSMEQAVLALGQQQIDQAIVASFEPKQGYACAFLLKRSSAQFSYAEIKGMGRAREERQAIQQAEALAGNGHLGFFQTCGIDPNQILELIQQKYPHRAPAMGAVDKQYQGLGHSTCFFGLLTAILALAHQNIPGYTAQVDHEQGDFPLQARHWLQNRRDGKRRAAYHSSTHDGAISHLILEETAGPLSLEWPSEQLCYSEANTPQELVAVLTQRLTELQRVLNLTELPLVPQQPSAALAIAFVVKDKREYEEAIRVAIRALTEHPHAPQQNREFRNKVHQKIICYTATPMGEKAKIAFVFPGSGSHFPQMGRELALKWTQVFRHMDQTTHWLADQLRADYFWSRKSLDHANQDHPSLLSAHVSLGIAVSDLTRTFGIEPQAVIGYSLGESAAHFALNLWRDRDEMHQRTQTSSLFTKELAGECTALHQIWGLSPQEKVDWTIGVITKSAAEVRKVLKRYPRVYLLIINTQTETVIGGDAQAVAQLVAELNTPFIALNGVVTVHCEAVGPVAEKYRQHHHFPTYVPPQVDIYSCSWGQRYQVNADTAADAMLAQALNGVDFPKTIKAAYEDGYNLFLEMGPGQSCTRMIGKILEDKPHLALALCHNPKEQVKQILWVMGRLLSERISLNLYALNPNQAQAYAGPDLGQAAFADALSASLAADAAAHDRFLAFGNFAAESMEKLFEQQMQYWQSLGPESVFELGKKEQ